MSPRTQLPAVSLRTSPLANRYLKAVDYTYSHSQSHLHAHANDAFDSSQPKSQSKLQRLQSKSQSQTAELSSSGTASMSSSSRTPTPVRASSRSPWQQSKSFKGSSTDTRRGRLVSPSPKSSTSMHAVKTPISSTCTMHVSTATSTATRDTSADSSRSPRRIRLFPETSPPPVVHADTIAGAIAACTNGATSTSRFQHNRKNGHRERGDGVNPNRSSHGNAAAAADDNDSHDESSIAMIMHNRRTTETRSPGKRQSDASSAHETLKSRPTTPARDYDADVNSFRRNGDAGKEPESWRRKLEGTSHGMKRSPVRGGIVVADASWIKKKAPPRLMGKQKKLNMPEGSSSNKIDINSRNRPAQETEPQPLTEEKLRARAQPLHCNADPAAAPTEVMMNLSLHRTQSDDHKSDFAGAPTEVATNRAFDLNRTAAQRDDVDERIDYDLQQGKRQRRGRASNATATQTSKFGISMRSNQSRNNGIITDATKEMRNDDQCSAVVFESSCDTRLASHVGNNECHDDAMITSDASFQSKSITSSVGVETGGRSIERAPIVLQRVLECTPNRGLGTTNARSQTNQQQIPVGDDIMEEFCATGTEIHPILTESATRREIKPIVSSEEEMLDNYPFLVQYPARNALHHRQQPQTISPASSGWTPVALSSGGLDHDDFQSGLMHQRDMGVQLLFSPNRVNNDVMDMMEFGPPRINRTAVLDDEMNSPMSIPRLNDQRTPKPESGAMVATGGSKLNVPTPTAKHTATTPTRAQSASRSLSREQILRRRAAANGVTSSQSGPPESVPSPSKVVITQAPSYSPASQAAPAKHASKHSSLVRDRIRKLNKQDTLDSNPLSKMQTFDEAKPVEPTKTWAPNLTTSATSVGGNPSVSNKSPNIAQLPAREHGWDSHVPEAQPQSLNYSSHNVPSNERQSHVLIQEKDSGHRNANRFTDRYLTSITAQTITSTENPVVSDAVDDNNTPREASIDCFVGERDEDKRSSRETMLSKGTGTVFNSPAKKLGSVSMMKSLFEPGTNEVPSEDDSSEDGLSVKSIRSIFEADQPTEKMEEANAVSKIRSMFEKDLAQRAHQKIGAAKRSATSYAISKAESEAVKMLISTGAAKTPLRDNHAKGHNPHHLVAKAQGSGSKQESHHSNEGEQTTSQSSLGRQPSIADRIIAMKLDGSQSESRKNQPSSYSTSVPIKYPHQNNVRTNAFNGSKNGTNGVKSKDAPELHHREQLPVRNRIAHQNHVPPYPDQKNTAAGHQASPSLNIANSRSRADKNGVRNENATRWFRQTTTQHLVPDNPALSRWGVAPPGKREVHGMEKETPGTSLQGAMRKKVQKTQGSRYIDGSCRTDSEGYDDGVTLDLSIAEVSVLTNPTCLRSKDDGSIGATSSRLSNADGIEHEGRGPSEASSSQTSEAAAPLIALTMRARYTNSSDDYGSFAPKTFGERLVPETQSKWVPLTAPIKEHGGFVNEADDSPDPAWDLRNIKARFMQRQADKAKPVEKRAQIRRAEGSSKALKQGELDGWEPFKSERFDESLKAETSQKARIKGSRGNDESRLGEKRSRKESVDAPSTVSTKPDVACFAREVSPRAAPMNKSGSKSKTNAPAPSSQQAALMTKLRALKEARIRRNTAFSKKTTGFLSTKTSSSRPPSGFSSGRHSHFSGQQRQSHYSDLSRGANVDEEQSAASTLSSTKFGGHKFEDCLDVD